MALSIGEKIPSFELPATDGNTYTADSILGEKATVIMFWCNHCPYVVPNQDRMIEMADVYRDKGVTFAAICANNEITHPTDNFEHMKQRSEEKGYNFPYLRDDSQDTTRNFGAERTPEIFAFDSNGTLSYHGRIDDNHEDVSMAQSHDLRNALDSLIAGETPAVQKTGAYGCSIKWK
ncbi:MAG TPA: thioredoxin family protein [bacterium]|jgi:peroxiredoxin